MKNTKIKIALVAAVLGCTALTSTAALTFVSGVNATGPALGAAMTTPISTVGALQNNTSPWSVVNNSLTPPVPFNGNFLSWVVANDSIATGYGFTGKTFIFQANVTSPDPLQAITINGFAGITHLGFGWTGALAPSLVSQSIGPAGNININFGNGYTGTGDFLYLLTDLNGPASLVQEGVQDTINATVQGFAPVPEPTTVLAGALMLLPLGVSTLRILRNRRTA